MISALTAEATTWLGYLQRGSVLIRIGLFVLAIAFESKLKRRLDAPLISSLMHLIVPGILVLVLTLPGLFLLSVSSGSRPGKAPTQGRGRPVLL